MNLGSFIYALRGHRLDFPNEDVLYILVSDDIACRITHLRVQVYKGLNKYDVYICFREPFCIYMVISTLKHQQQKKHKQNIKNIENTLQEQLKTNKKNKN